MTPDELQAPAAPTLDLYQYLQIMLNVMIGWSAGWFTRKGFDEASSGILAGAAGGVLMLILKSVLERTKLLKTDPASPVADPAVTPASIKTLAVLLVLVPLLHGCALAPTVPADPAQRLALADKAAGSLADSFRIAIDDKLITDKHAIAVGKAAIDELNAVRVKAHASTQPADAAFWVGELEAALPRAVDFIAKLKAEKPKVEGLGS